MKAANPSHFPPPFCRSGIFFSTAVIFLCLLLCFPGAGSARDAKASGEQAKNPRASGIMTNMKEVPLKDFIQFVGKYTGRNIVYRVDRIPSRKITIYSNQSMEESQLMSIFQEILKSTGLYAASKGDVLYIMPRDDVQSMDEPFTQKPAETEEDLVSTVYQLPEDIPVKETANLVKKLKSSIGSVQPIPQARSLLIRDTQKRISKVVDVLQSIHRIRPEWQTTLVELEEAKAAPVVKKIKTFYKGLSDRGRQAVTPFLLPIEWSNSFLVAGTEEHLSTVDMLVSRMDKTTVAESKLKVYDLQNAKANSAAKVLESLITSKIEEQKKGGASASEGSFKVSADTKTNSLLVMIEPDLEEQVDKIVEHLDRRRSQVFVKALILETSLSKSQRFGTEWFAGGGEDNDWASVAGFVNDNPDNAKLLGFVNPVIDNKAPGVSSMAGGFSIGALGNIITFGNQKFPTLGAMVDFLKDASGFNIISVPQITTLDNSEAEIFVGKNRPFQVTKEFDSNNNPIINYEYRDVGVKLNVTPHINNENDMIRLDLKQEVKNVDQSAEELVTVDRNTKTSVRLRDGATIVISGLVENTRGSGSTAVPEVSKVPLLGWLFKRESTSAEKRTLMIFITAQIIDTTRDMQNLTDKKMERSKQNEKELRGIYQKEFGRQLQGDKPFFEEDTIQDFFQGNKTTEQTDKQQ